MASIKIGTLIIRTLAKPLANQVKERARQHPRFREMCIDLAQFMYRTEIKLRTNILGEASRPHHVRPLSETRAIDQGANFIAEGFMFSVAAGLIIGETWRSSRNQSKRRDTVDDQLEDLAAGLADLRARLDGLTDKWDVQLQEEKQRNDELARILERVVEIGLRGGWAEFEGTPLQLPRIQLNTTLKSPSSSSLLSSSPSGSSSSIPPLGVSIEGEEGSELHSISDLPPHDTKIDVVVPPTDESGSGSGSGEGRDGEGRV